MKKALSIVLMTVIVVSSTMGANATEISKQRISIVLEMTSDSKEINYIKSTYNLPDTVLTKECNNVSLDISMINILQDVVEVSGECSVEIYGDRYSFDFDKQQLSIEESKGTQLYSGLIEGDESGNNFLMDLTCTNDFQKAIVTITLYTDNQERLMFYGDKFDEQISLFNEAKTLIGKEDLTLDNQSISQVGENETEAIATSGSKIRHVMNFTSKNLGGVDTGKQSIVVNIAKKEPSVAGGSGREIIRVFSRTHNIPKVVDGILRAEPYKVHVEFKGDDGEMMGDVTTYPSGSGSSFPKALQFAYSVYAAATSSNTIVAIVNLFIEGFVSSTGNAVDVNGVNATFNMRLEGVNKSKLDLPSGVLSSDAEEDETHGVAFEVAYDMRTGYKNPDITVSANMTYRIYYNTDRVGYKTSGTTSYTHVA